MFYDQPSLLTQEHITNELAAARRHVDESLHAISTFSTLFSPEPWRHLDDLLAELRAAVTTVAVLEDVTAKLS